MNYKDCYHSDVCGFECDEATTFCANFKDKSRIIELPCKLGQTVYVVDNHLPKTFLGIVETTFCGFEISSNGNNRYFVKKNGSKESFGDDDVGLSIFFTQKEAEERLKELEK